MSRVEVNQNFRREYANGPGREWQQRVAPMVRTAVETQTPISTGYARTAYRTSPFTDDAGNPSVRLVNKTDYIQYPDQGTGLWGPFHKVITSHTVGKALSWIAKTGERVFAMAVKGQRGQHFFRRGLETIHGRVVEYKYGKPGT